MIAGHRAPLHLGAAFRRVAAGREGPWLSWTPTFVPGLWARTEARVFLPESRALVSPPVPLWVWEGQAVNQPLRGLFYVLLSDHRNLNFPFCGKQNPLSEPPQGELRP